MTGTGAAETLTGNSGGAVSPTSNNINVVGTGSITTVGTPLTSTLTAELTGLTNHSLLVGAGTPTITNLGVATNGQLPIGSTGADPVLSTLTAGSGVTISNGAGSITISATGSGGTITTIDGDTGSITGATVTIYANNAGNVCGKSVEFVNSGTVSTLNVTDTSSQSTIIGFGAGAAGFGAGLNDAFGQSAMFKLTSGSTNSAFANAALASVTSGSNNTAFGASTAGAITTGSSNTAFGSNILNGVATGSFNSAFGYAAGNDYTGAESSNIVIANSGVTGESNVIRIGTQGSGSGQQNECFIAGIEGVSVSNLNMVTINTATGQLGSQAFIVPALTVTFVAHAASPYTVLATDQFLAVDVSGGVVTIKLPNAPTTGRVIYIKDSKGAAATSNISVTTVGGTVTIDGQTTSTMNVNYQSINVVFDGTNYEVF